MSIGSQLKGITKEVKHQRGILEDANKKFRNKPCPVCESTKTKKIRDRTFCRDCGYLHIPGAHPIKFDTYRKRETG